MQFIDRAPLYRIIHISGPTHNLLGLQLTLEPTSREPELEVLDSPAGGRDPAVEHEIAKQVMLGIVDACRETGAQYYVEKIQYVSDDSPPFAIYRYLAVEIVRRVELAKQAAVVRNE